jgi:antitoxin component of RelBE/YafQ-DinJ toxin-antitoxin module
VGDDGRSPIVAVRIPEAILERARRAATARGLSISAAIRLALVEWLERTGREGGR